MLIVLCIYLIVSFFEVRHLFKTAKKKEGAIYIAVFTLAVSLGTILILSPNYNSFANFVFNILGIKS
ncbi:MAG: hypothetical protein PHO15_02100 [Eubacteriales bacterium]|nr:hypothetical protein [Eubacteriales bacterium]